MSALSVVILAAGKGTRMKSDKAKVLHEVAGVPMVGHVIDAALTLDPAQVILVIGHQAETVKATLDAYTGPGKLNYAIQAEQNGTAHAVLCAKEAVTDEITDVLILCGDTPLLTGRTLQRLQEAKQAQDAALVMLSFNADDPTGYGRILRDDSGKLMAIREHRDCTPAQREIKESNAGIYLIDRDFLFGVLGQVSTNNDQGEYYLTDVVEMAYKAGKTQSSVILEDEIEVSGVNDREQLAFMEDQWRSRNKRPA